MVPWLGSTFDKGTKIQLYPIRMISYVIFYDDSDVDDDHCCDCVLSFASRDYY
jgi:hypothetical protein